MATKNALAIKEVLTKITGDSWKEKYPAHYESYQRLNPEPDFNELTRQLVKMWLDTGRSGYPNEKVKDISCALFIVRGDKDPVISTKDIVELSGIVKNPQLLNIPEAGHVAFKDQQKIFMKSLNEFLKKIIKT